MTKPYEIGIYRTDTGKEPYTEWEESLDKATMGRIDARLARIREAGSIGTCKPVGDGVYEMKFDFGPGYRIYFGLETDIFMILLLGGSKKDSRETLINQENIGKITF